MKPVHLLSMFQFLIYTWLQFGLLKPWFLLWKITGSVCIFTKPEHVIPFYISFYFLVSRPQPLSTISKRSANEKVMSRAGFINNVLNKIEEVWLGKGATPESSPSRRWAEIKSKMFLLLSFQDSELFIHSYIHLSICFWQPESCWGSEPQTLFGPFRPLPGNSDHHDLKTKVKVDPHQCTDYVEMR